VVPTAVAILIALFAIQSPGTANIGRAFGPVMAAWFGAIALLGIWGIAMHPGVLLGVGRISVIATRFATSWTG
jgi:KUP system potassium uptake protein